MDEERLKGVGKQVSGSLKEAVGKVTGDTRTEAEGAAEKAAGKAQDAVSRAKNKVLDQIDD